jgi:hypothetical protein
MGDWSDYFEDVPEENPANYVNGVFDPTRAKAKREQENKLAKEQAALDAEIREIVKRHNPSEPSAK